MTLRVKQHVNDSARLRIDNAGYAQSNVLFGRILPGVVILGGLWSLVSLAANGLTRGAVVPTLLTGLLICYMGVSIFLRGRHPAVRALEFFPDRLDVAYTNRRSSIEYSRVRAMEYEGIRNRARVNVAGAPFPEDAQRILVITLDDRTELRVVVDFAHDQPLKEVAATIEK